jgi:hypothetical protein
VAVKVEATETMLLIETNDLELVIKTDGSIEAACKCRMDRSTAYDQLTFEQWRQIRDYIDSQILQLKEPHNAPTP